MKKLTILLFLLMPVITFAQLKAPTSVAADTLIIVSCFYDGTEVKMGDWPAQYFVETPQTISIAGQKYTKNKSTRSDIHEYVASWNGYVNYYSWANATVNGKKANLYRVEPTKGCENYPALKYGIDDYSFYVINLSLINSIWPTLIEKVKEILTDEEGAESAEKKVKAFLGENFEERLMWYQYFALQIFAHSDDESE